MRKLTKSQFIEELVSKGWSGFPGDLYYILYQLSNNVDAFVDFMMKYHEIQEEVSMSREELIDDTKNLF